MAKRRKIMGLPIGKKKPAISGKALLAAGAGLAALPGAITAARKAPGAMSAFRKVGQVVSSGASSADKLSDVAAKAGHLTEAIGSHGTTIGKVGAAVSELKKLGNGDSSGTPKLSHLIEEHKEIAVPRRVAYDQWTQFEMFPSIVKGAEQVEQVRRDRTSWTSKIGPAKRQWTAQITEQIPDERIAWKSSDGLDMKGVVTFHSLTDDLTRVLVQIEYTPRGAGEKVANVLRVQRRRVRRDLRLFKHFLELRGDATGAWRQRVAKKQGDDNSRSSASGSNNAQGNGHGRTSRSSSSARNGSGASSGRQRSGRGNRRTASSRSS